MSSHDAAVAMTTMPTDTQHTRNYRDTQHTHRHTQHTQRYRDTQHTHRHTPHTHRYRDTHNTRTLLTPKCFLPFPVNDWCVCDHTQSLAFLQMYSENI